MSKRVTAKNRNLKKIVSFSMSPELFKKWEEIPSYSRSKFFTWVLSRVSLRDYHEFTSLVQRQKKELGAI